MLFALKFLRSKSNLLYPAKNTGISVKSIFSASSKISI